MLAVECRPSSIEFRLRTGYVDVAAKDLDEALATIETSPCSEDEDHRETRAVLLRRLGRFQDAETEYRRRKRSGCRGSSGQ
jgi:hypothetical protein